MNSAESAYAAQYQIHKILKWKVKAAALLIVGKDVWKGEKIKLSLWFSSVENEQCQRPGCQLNINKLQIFNIVNYLVPTEVKFQAMEISLPFDAHSHIASTASKPHYSKNPAPSYNCSRKTIITNVLAKIVILKIHSKPV